MTKLCEVPGSVVTSVKWLPSGTTLAVGTGSGRVLLYDAVKCRQTAVYSHHTQRVAVMAASGNQLASGSRDRRIELRDVRTPETSRVALVGHQQEVCGLQFSPDGQLLASGGNDNRLYVWQPSQRPQPLYKFTDHTAAIKAIAWSPHQHGLLATGGGTADQSIRFWSTLTGQPLQVVYTGSQVCNLAWSRNSNELVSTHGYSQNQIVIWKYPTMGQLAVLTGHTMRVLFLVGCWLNWGLGW